MTAPHAQRFNRRVLEADTVVAERFRMVRELGRGGMGSVWLAHHLGLDVPCAVKFVDEKVTAPGLRLRFEAEARAAARLKGPHVVQILDHGVWEGQPYIAMELLEGEDLAARLHAATRLSFHETAIIVTHVARALMRAHAAGVVHRDLKPANIFLTSDEGALVVKVLDFGIAKITEPSQKSAPDTLNGQLLGTPEYMSPEQFQGRQVDFRSDLWSMGVIAFECLTGTSPFRSETLYDTSNNVVHKPIPSPSTRAPNLPPRLDRWWERAMARDPNDRFLSAREMATSLCLALGVTADDAPASSVGPYPTTLPGTMTPAPRGQAPTLEDHEEPPRPRQADTPTLPASAAPARRRAPARIAVGLLVVAALFGLAGRARHRVALGGSGSATAAPAPMTSTSTSVTAALVPPTAWPERAAPSPPMPSAIADPPAVPRKASAAKASPGTKPRPTKPADVPWDPGF